MQQLRLFDVELLEIFKTHWYHVWQVVWEALSVADEICFFFQFQFPLSTICQCFAWFFANGCDEYLSICVFQHTQLHIQNVAKIINSRKSFEVDLLMWISWSEFSWIELERLTAGGDKGEISLSKVLSERFSLTSSSSILQLQPNFYSSLISYFSILNPSFSNLLKFASFCSVKLSTPPHGRI